MTAFVVDANAIHEFQQERISNTRGEAHNAIDAIFKSNCIALDKEELCYQEWIDCARGTFPLALADWVSDQLVAGKVKFFDLAPNTCRKSLLRLGLPVKDHKWIRLAMGSGGRRLVTEDIDFFDPTKKSANAAIKTAIKKKRTGSCAKALVKAHAVSVMCLCHVPDDVAALSQ